MTHPHMKLDADDSIINRRCARAHSGSRRLHHAAQGYLECLGCRQMYSTREAVEATNTYPSAHPGVTYREPPKVSYFVARGSVRGDCQHRHRTVAAAERCADKDSRACASLTGGAYSDRRAVEVRP